MMIKDFARAGHWPTLLAAFIYFDISFCIWYIFGPLANFIGDDLVLTATQKGLLVATPLLGGSLFRIAMGMLTDHIGPRKAGIISIGLTFVPLLFGWLFANSFLSLLMVALLLGVPGASFAVALPLVSRWYPAKHQGLALGIAGAGNSGTVLAALLIPRLAAAYGWHMAMGYMILPISVVGFLFVLLVKESPTKVPPKRFSEYFAVLEQSDTLWFCFFYLITFGGFVGLASYLSIFFHDQYGISHVMAGDLTALCVFAGSFMRPIGGALADIFGGRRMLVMLYGVVALLVCGIATTPPLWVALALFVSTLAFLGMGNGSVFQLIPQRFGNEIGVITGLVGAAGGLGGFFLPTALGVIKDTAGTYASGFLIFAFFCITSAFLVLRKVRQ
jgi:NNP family nitrate/nitrite transporter-like MFS transporter